MSFILIGIKKVIFSKETYAFFTLAKISHFTAWFLLLLRNVIPDFFSVIIGNALLFLGWYLETSAIININAKNKTIDLLIRSITIVGISIFIIFSKNSGIRVGISSLLSVLIFIVFIIGLLLIKHKTYLPKLMAGLSLFFCVPLIVRAVWGFSQPIEVSLKTPTVIQNIVFLTAFLVFITNSIGYLLLIKEKQEDLLAENEERFSKAFYSSPQALLIIDLLTKRISEVNNNFSELIGYGSKEVIGKNINELKIWKNFIDIEKIVDSQDEIVTDKVLELKSLSGKDLIVKTTMIKFKVNNKVVALLAILDITLQTDYENKLQENAEKLKELNETKDKFFSILAHDLRSPFNIFLNYSEFLANESYKIPREEIVEMSKSLNESLNKQFELLTDLLNWSRMQNGNYMPEKSRFFIGPIIQNVCEQQSINANRKRITFYFNFDKSIKIDFDEDMFKLVFRNLISNAIKFTNYEGVITVKSIVDNDLLWIEVIDNGIGIESAKLSNIFENYHASTTGTLGEKGTGLGLMLCKEIIEKHGGEIGVRSKIGEGSTFYFSIPT